jgi:hypothetical protein
MSHTSTGHTIVGEKNYPTENNQETSTHSSIRVNRRLEPFYEYEVFIPLNLSTVMI